MNKRFANHLAEKRHPKFIINTFKFINKKDNLSGNKERICIDISTNNQKVN